MNWLLGNLKFILGGSAALILFLSGWFVNGWRRDVEIQTLKLEYARSVEVAEQSAKAKEAAVASRILSIDEKRTKELAHAHTEIDRLSRAVASGAGVLRATATCGNLSRTAAGSGVDHAAAARLTDSAQRDYFVLRGRIEEITTQLKACQDVLREERK